ncbi:major facilitator superfamily transporter [Pyrenophora seminiperda CCB06]|uniref:Major facilitator superfamily transporter n=1 Tax=Pyrenophora seminiperda CCB06 TaxID=1302712 RepID=A0A3M7M4X4_9PLEO|nr:major facilitator superfamily transporter [Pyrenophora seminiperda CCB06]
MRTTSPLFAHFALTLAIPTAVYSREIKPIYWLLAGDSTTASNGGWGDAFLSTTVTNGSSGHNYGHSGATTKSFRDGGDWAKVTRDVETYKHEYNVYVTIQFGHNDQKPASGVSLTDYRNNLVTFASEIIQSGGTPILVTPLTRRTFNSTTQHVIENLANETAITIDVAGSESLYYINLNKASTQYVNAIGQTGADRYNWGENGTTGKDRTHLSPWGEVVFARMVSDLLVENYGEDFKQWTLGNETLSRLIRDGKFLTMSLQDQVVSDEPIELLDPSPPKPSPGPIGLENTAQIPQYPRGIRLVLITIGLVLSVFLAALDSTIIATAIPSITTQFGGISNIAWYGTSYSLTNTAFQAVWGKAYQYFNLKVTFLCAIAAFEVGNVICATAPSSEVLIFGRVVAGLGGGGIMTGAFIIIAMTAGPEYRAAYMGIGGLTFGCASVIGPLLGGALTDGPGWTWCFWINLPIGFVAALTMWICFKNPAKPKEVALNDKLFNLDINGAVILSGCFACFIMAMHWVGTMPWTSACVVGSFLGFVGLFVCFVANEYAMGNKAMVQAHLFKNKLVFANLWYAFFLAGSFFPLLYTLPIEFQSVNNNTASQSGVRLIPLVLGVSVFTLVSNGLLTFWRHYKPFLLIGALFAVAGNAKIYTLDASTSTKDWVGYEFLTAIGVGLALQIPMIANQALVSAEDLSAATSMSLFMENCGTVLFVASSEAAFTSGLVRSIVQNLPAVEAKSVLDAGATQIRSSFAGRELHGVIGAYLQGSKTSHLVPVVCGAIAGAISLTNAGPATVKEVRRRMKYKSHER